MNIKAKFGNQIKKMRLAKGISQETLASLANLDRTYIPSIEKGERNVSISVIEKLSKAFEVSISQLFDKL